MQGIDIGDGPRSGIDFIPAIDRKDLAAQRMQPDRAESVGVRIVGKPQAHAQRTLVTGGQQDAADQAAGKLRLRPLQHLVERHGMRGERCGTVDHRRFRQRFTAERGHPSGERTPDQIRTAGHGKGDIGRTQ